MTKLRAVSCALLAIMIFSVSPASADEPSSAQEALLEQLELRPGGIVAGNTIEYEDGTVFVAVDAGTFSLGQCTSNKFCIWGLPSYSGSFLYKSGSGSKPISGTVGSFWNNRSSVARLYTNTGSSYTCYGAGVKKASVTSSYSSADSVFLASGTSC